MSTIQTPDSLKSLRETLCVAQTGIGYLPGMASNDTRVRHIEAIGRVIEDIDRQRPLGPDGKHDDRHTATCGCEDKPAAGVQS